MGKQQCDICGKESEDKESDTLLFGDWMIRQTLRVHYFCLLLSTDLPQRGGDSSGILGFLLRDIRKEAVAAKKHICVYCHEKGASIACHKCHTRFHLDCSLSNRCTSEFCGDFRSYCDACTPLDDYKRQLLANPPQNKRCDICLKAILPFSLHNVAYGDCCRKGFAHRMCMRRYALASGYYLRCIWCRKEKFRDIIRQQSIFVPDRDASWERQKNAYQDLHHKHMRCDHKNCLCPKGRDYNKHGWIIFPCKLCASIGAHLKCLTGTLRLSRGSEPVEFKCDVCLEVEQKLLSNKQLSMLNASDTGITKQNVEMSFYVPKSNPNLPVDLNTQTQPVFSDEENSENSDVSGITVIASQRASCIATSKKDIPVSVEATKPSPVNILKETIVNIPDSPQTQLQSQLQSDHEYSPGLVIRQSFTCAGEPFFYLVTHEFDERGSGDCTGSCTLRFATDDPRLKDRSPEALQNLLITEEDIWCRDTDRGIFSLVHSKILSPCH
ncbi:G2/M phase-specific E3 ubiquitin-protein ligase [Drosophila pseudoobscura]|uniref:G2/M phase-specific E3 ubiquitin-protein ligase n=1 Tax=Drosophila pseudoobscura pseudoobscura TaxID=46245 RepID=A0A6I8UYM1_DROPS|nr:G2/M phase-specific E3 ubiquitin-protein ligase [Drosophila pseudoobscura]